ncbi:hypothetical protein BD410DRAFT_846931 [Rickenella mellea]|uniref:Uncharacterized protein n=1 Tax=Rickenella mellea TaxID=50990 RepID=A0A4Y7PEM9_9AGAM|nr:hypothetical protein BD410DRAFT_846931 [Rickenella mellea]
MSFDPSDVYAFAVGFREDNLYKNDPEFRKLCVDVASLSCLVLMGKPNVIPDDINYVIIPGGVHDSFAKGGIKRGDHLTVQCYSNLSMTWVIHIPCDKETKIFIVDEAEYLKQ